MAEPITFLAALAGQNTAAKWLSVSSEGDAKVVLEVDKTNLAAVLRLISLSGATFRVTVEAES